MDYKQRWGLRPGDSDISDSESESEDLGVEPDHENENEQPILICPPPVANPETSKFQQIPAVSGQTETVKAVSRKRGRGIEIDLNKKYEEPKVVRRKKGKTEKGENNNAALIHLETVINTLLNEHKVTRMGLSSWMMKEMKKGAAEERTKEKIQIKLQHQNKSEVKKSVRFNENVQVLNFVKDIEEQPQENVYVPTKWQPMNIEDLY